MNYSELEKGGSIRERTPPIKREWYKSIDSLPSIAKLLDPASNWPGKKKVWTFEEALILSNKIKRAALHGFSVDKNMLKATLQNMTADGSPDTRTALPLMH